MQNNIIKVKLFPPGIKMYLKTGKQVTIEHVHLRGYALFVKVLEERELIHSDWFEVAPTEYRLKSD